MKTSLKLLLLGLFLAVVGGAMAMSNSSVVFYIGLGLAAAGILLIIAISVNRTGI